MCHVRPAAFCCNCQLPPAFLCDGHCLLQHQTKNPLITHAILPVSAAGQDSEDYMRKFNCLKKGAAELRRNLESMDQFDKSLLLLWTARLAN